MSAIRSLSSGDPDYVAQGGDRKSVIVCAAIDVDRLSGDEAGIFTDQEQAGRGNLVDAALPPKRDPGGVRQVTLIPLRVVASRIDAARRNDVNADVMGSEFRGEPARHADQPHLRRRQMSAATAASGNRAVADEEQNAPVAIPHHWLYQRARQVERAVKNYTTDRINSQSAWVVSMNGLCGRIAALLIRMSTRPNSDTALAASASTSAFFPTSARIATALTPKSRASRATVSASS